MLSFVLWIYAALVVVLYLWGTCKLLFTYRVPVHQQYAPWDGGEPPLSPAKQAKLDADVASLAAVGFQRHGYVSHTRPDRASAIGEVMDLPDGSAVAGVFAVVKGAKPRRPSVITTITTEFSDGTRLGVTNSWMNYPMRANPRAEGHRFSMVQDPARLFALHRMLLARHGGTIAPRRVENPAKFFGERVDEEWARQHSLGIVAITNGDMYRPTIPGALLMVWRMMPPSSYVIRVLAAWRGERLAMELERK